jgi:hypothetical protein
VVEEGTSPQQHINTEAEPPQQQTIGISAAKQQGSRTLVKQQQSSRISVEQQTESRNKGVKRKQYGTIIATEQGAEQRAELVKIAAR